MTRQGLIASPGSADPKTHGHTDRYASAMGTARVSAGQMSDVERDAAKAAHRLVIENDKAWHSAQTVVASGSGTFLSRKISPAGLGACLVDAMVRDHRHVARADRNHLAVELFGVDVTSHGCCADLAFTAARASDKRAQVIALGLVLADYETSQDCASSCGY